MATFTKNTFSTTYKDDFDSADNFHRILFNSGRALQARELTQMQTIIQEEVARFGRNVFKDGAAVNPGGPTVNNSFEFVKLNTTTNQLPTDTSTLIGLELTGANSSVKGRVVRVETASGSDPATLYVQYTNTDTSGLSGTSVVRFTAGENITGGGETLTVQTTNTVANPATGQGTIISNAGGDFFVRGHFVFAQPQSVLLSKYSKFPDEVVGFTVTEDIVTSADNTALFDNQGATPNTTSPGADRYRIRLTLAKKSDVSATDNFVFYCDVVNGEIIEQVTGADQYNKINEVLALRTKEESGNYIVNPFRVNFEEDSAGGSTSNLIASVSKGTAYINGYRFNTEKPTKLVVSKPRTTTTINNEAIGVNYGSFVLSPNILGNLGIASFGLVNLRNAVEHGGTTIGTARVRSIAEDGANYKIYLFDINMNSGQSFRNVKSIGSSTTDYANLILESSKAVLKESTQQSLVFPLPKSRPKNLSDISLEVQRMFTGTANGSGQLTLTLSTSGETFVNTSDWLVTTDATGLTDSDASFSSVGSNSITISNLGGGAAVTVYAKVNKSVGQSRTKTLTEETHSGTMVTDSNGVSFLKLPRADIFEVLSIKQTDSSGADLSAKFEVDNGQRVNYYQHGRLVVRKNTSAPTGTIFSRYKFFSHGATGDFFSVNSYTGQVNYEDIPNLSISSRESLNLRDVLDFRSVRDSGGLIFGDSANARSNAPTKEGSTGGGAIDFGFDRTGSLIHELPSNGDIVTVDAEYYLPRSDKIVANQDGTIKLESGEPGFSRQLPPTPENTLNLFELNLNGYGISDSDLSTRVMKAKRFRMEDIARLEERIDDLEETTALTFLEQQTETLLITDSSGTARTKTGFLVDNFKDRAFSDTQDPDYRASINPVTKTLHPHVSVFNIPLKYDSAKSSNTILKGDNVYLHYDHVSAIENQLISGTENVNPFAVVVHEGQITLSPESDVWVNTEYEPANVTNVDVTVDQGVIQGQAPQPFSWNGVQLPNFQNVGQLDTTNWFGNWNWNWNGVSNVEEISDVTQGRRRTRTFSQTITSSEVVNEVIADRTVSLTFLPFMRPRLVFYKVEGLRPETRYFPFFDGVAFDNFIRAGTSEFTNVAGQTYVGNQYQGLNTHPNGSTNIVTDANGAVEGSFLIPSSDTNRFRSGDREFKLLDISVDNQSSATSFASKIFTSRGTIDTRQQDIISTRTTTIATRQWEEVTWSDPLGQTFMVTAPSGMFVTKVECYFQTKDTSIPVQLQIRPVVNGAPSSDHIVPGSSVFVNPTSVQVPDDINTATQAQALEKPTTFEFTEPVFLNGDTEYSIVLLSDCTSYNAYVGETYEFELGSTERRINRQPSLGSLFKSQNGTTWEPDQTKDLAFKMFKASFNTAGGHATFENVPVPDNLLRSNPILTVTSDSDVTVLAPDHGFKVNDTVTISGFDSAGTGVINGIDSAGLVNGTHTVTAVDGNSYQFKLNVGNTTSGLPNASGYVGGARVKTTRQVVFDIAIPTLDNLVPEDTTLSFSGKFMTGSSLAGNETRFQKDASFSTDLVLNTDNTFTAPRLVATSANETTELGAGEKSVTIRANMNTIRADVSPVVDTQRTALTTAHHRIDNQVSAGATAGVSNVPLLFVAETQPFGGSALSKHITRPITLLEDAINLKILLSALKPNGASFDVFFRTATEGQDITQQSYTLANIESPVAADNANFKEYRYLASLQNAIESFNQYQVKIVMHSVNSSKVPLIKDLRIIALAT